MHQDWTSEFSGVSGRVLRETLSAGTLLSGVCLGFFLTLGGWLLAQLGARDMVAPFAQVVIALALARFAVNGLFGEWRGTIFSSAGGSWARVTMVAAFYFALSAIWLLPAFLLTPAADEFGPELASLAQGMGGGRVLALLLVCVLGIGLTPPVFLIVAVSAEGFADLVSAAHCKRLFQGRLGDLCVVYVLYLGSLLAALVLTLPLIVAAFGRGVEFGLFVSGLDLLFTGGLAVTLLGRLCGFYAFGEPEREAQAAADLPHSAPPQHRTPTPPAPAGSRPAGATAAPPRAPAAVRQPQPTGTVPAPTHAAAPPAAGAQRHLAAPGARPATAAAAANAAAPRSTSVPADAAAPSAVKPLHPSGKPSLMDAQRRVDEAQRMMEQDPSRAISMLEELRSSHAPHPLILHALCLMRQGAGHLVEALEVAREALPLCFERGSLIPAAEIFRALAASVKELGLNRDQILSIAAALAKAGDLGTAAQTYAGIVRLDAGERRAIKGLLQIADLKMQDPARTGEAEKIYRFLMQHCASSPLADDMRRGLEEAQRRLARVR